MLGLCHLFFSGKITVGHCVGKVPERIWNRMHSKTVVLAANNLLTSALQIFITGLKVIITLTKKKKKKARNEMKTLDWLPEQAITSLKMLVAAAFLKFILPADFAKE